MQLSCTSPSAINVQNGLAKGRPIVLLHGLLGQLSNWKHVKERFEYRHRVFAPELPLFNGFWGNKLDRLVQFLENYIAQNQIDQPVLIGNSLGGHIALLYTLKHPKKVAKLVLTGSSGLYENTFGGTFPRVKDYGYIKGKVEDVFDRKEVVDEALVNHIFEIVQQKPKALSIIGLARDAQKQNLKNQLPNIKVPTLLLWGLQDVVTPPAVAEQFKQLLPQATLHYLDNCGHAPMMEQPELFNLHLSNFLASNYVD
ncbi:alpha/beta hydrolase [Pedobacter sp. KR3-3]|uniref:Alpha/beta hydrolase n=1 Tax=Pedobacter albus TaxID=3113905 RepID=A0ABU7I682_9SPHI|nr:alpha/beta hydrolase [Pedobacter sp. KR3-3]MEE1944841.1 alpha/beta hydrolase [Pedobacter sp. KR3-3]